MKKRHTIIFDMDGTLLNTLDDIADSINYALGECGYPLRQIWEVRKMLGGGASVLADKAAPAGTSIEEKTLLKDVFMRHYIKNSNIKTDLYDGIKPLVSKLRLEGYKLGIVSNKGDQAVQDLTKVYFQGDMQMALGERPEITRKPAPDALLLAMKILGSAPEECIYVGDSEVDAQFAKNAGVPCIIVTWGFRDREELVAANPDAIVDTMEELYEEIHRMGDHTYLCGKCSGFITGKE